MKTVYSVITPVNGVTKNNPGKLFYLPQDVLEWAGRICYNSNKHFRKNPDFLYDKIVTTGHLDVLEHGYFGCEFEVEPLFDVGDLYYFYYIFKEKYPFMSISLLPGEKKIGMYGNFRVWYNLFCDNYAQIWGFIGRQDMQELQIWLSTLVPNVFHYPQWLNGQKNTIGKLIQDEYANSFSNTSSHKVYTTSDGVDVMMLSRTPKSDFTNRFHVAFQISKCSREMTHQLVRHRLLSFCLSGNTEVNSFGGDKKWTMEELYNWSQDTKRKGRLKLITLRGMSDDRKIIPVKIKSVINSGKKDVYEVVTKSGRKIKSTLLHLYNTPNGWKKLEELSIGDKVWTNGILAYMDRDFVHENYIIQNKERKVLASEIGCADATLGKWIARFGLQKPKCAYPNRRTGKHHTPMSEEQKKQISTRMSGANNPGWKGDDVGESGGRVRANKMYIADECSLCGSDYRVQRHHIDKNTRNNSVENIEILCEPCHKARHNNKTKIVLPDEIVSISYIGVENTYDLEIDHECHNFIANGFVVHNSQRSQRYVDESNFTTSRPKSTPEQTTILDNHFKDVNVIYKQLRDSGMKKQDARCILPNATHTELVVSGTDVGWKHFLKLRCASDAQEQIRNVAFCMKDMMEEEYGSIIL